MKKYGFFIAAILFIVTIFAQKTLNIFKKDLSVVNIPLNDVDSIKFNNGLMNVYKSNNNVVNVSVSDVDSINFSDSIQQYKLQISTLGAISVLNNTATSGIIIKSIGTTSIIEKGICWSTSENPTIDDNKLVSYVFNDTSQLQMAGLVENSTYYVRAYAIDDMGIIYGNQITFITTNYSLPVVELLSSSYNYSTGKTTCVVNVKSNGGCSLQERGICWSTKHAPTTTDRKYSSGTSTGQFYAMTGILSLDSVYYIRSFATNCIGTTYSTETKLQPLMGNVTFTLDIDSTSYPEYYRLIKTAMDSACWYYNRYTTFRGNIYVYYNSGIPTAQSNYHGSIGFGPNTTYMWVGTAMHEMAHFLGSGTTQAWQSKLVNGIWTGTVASNLLKNATGEILKGDNNSNPIHFWPYGINYKSEITNLGSVTNQQNALILHCKLVKAMVIDDAGLPNSW